MTYTVARLPVSAATFNEIVAKLRQAGYDHAFTSYVSVNMNGVELEKEPMPQEPPNDKQTLRVIYTNHRGETAERAILPASIRYGSTEWHPNPQWLLLAWDFEKKAMREFAMQDMSGVA